MTNKQLLAKANAAWHTRIATRMSFATCCAIYNISPKRFSFCEKATIVFKGKLGRKFNYDYKLERFV